MRLQGFVEERLGFLRGDRDQLAVFPSQDHAGGGRGFVLVFSKSSGRLSKKFDKTLIYVY